MNNAFPYSTDAPGLKKNFHPFRFESPPRRGCNLKDIEYATYDDHDPLYLPPAVLNQLPEPDMNTPRFPKSIFAPTHYGMDYKLSAPRIQGYSTRHREGYYMDVYGRPAKTTLNFPYVLQVYTPKPFEESFQTKESALTRAPQYGDWQIVNVFTGQHVYAPHKTNSHSYVCN